MRTHTPCNESPAVFFHGLAKTLVFLAIPERIHCMTSQVGYRATIPSAGDQCESLLGLENTGFSGRFRARFQMRATHPARRQRRWPRAAGHGTMGQTSPREAVCILRADPRSLVCFTSVAPTTHAHARREIH